MTAAGWLALPLAACGGVLCAGVGLAYASAIARGSPADCRTLLAALRAGLRVPADASAASSPCPRRARVHRWLATICALLLCLAWLPFAMQPSMLAAARGGACAVLLVLAVIDARCRLLPDALTLPLLAMGLLLAAIGVSGVRPADAVVAAAGGYLLLAGIDAVFRAWRGHDGLGGGDMKLVAALGAWLGWEALPAVLLAASLAAVAYSLPRRAWCLPLPFGPFLAGAAAAGLAGGPVVQLVFCLGKAVCTRSA